MVKVKICGVTNAADAELAARDVAEENRHVMTCRPLVHRLAAKVVDSFPQRSRIQGIPASDGKDTDENPVDLDRCDGPGCLDRFRGGVS